MGCDLHSFVEHKYKDLNYWDCFGGELYLGRDYEMFGYLTDGQVRSDNTLKCSVEPRGLPDGPLSWDVEEKSKMNITEDGEGENETTLENAKRWGKKIYYNSDGKPYKVDHPDWHSHSWLTYKEYKDILSEMKRKRIRIGTGYKAVLAVMETYEKAGHETRFIFWFDN